MGSNLSQPGRAPGSLYCLARETYSAESPQWGGSMYLKSAPVTQHALESLSLLSKVTRSPPSPGHMEPKPHASWWASNQNPFAKHRSPTPRPHPLHFSGYLLRSASAEPGTRAHQDGEVSSSVGDTTIHPDTQAGTPGIILGSPSPPSLICHHTLLSGLQIRIFLNLSASEDPHSCCLDAGPDQKCLSQI